MSADPNFAGANFGGSTFNNVRRDQFNQNYQITNYGPKSDLSDILAPVVDAAYNRRHGPISRCHPSTREEVIARIVRWADGVGDHPICWLSGPAGSGKSAISQTIAERYADKGRLAGSFFFLRGAGERSVIARLIPTLSYQLSLAIPAAKPLVQRAIKNEPHIASTSFKDQYQKLVIKPILGSRKPALPFLPQRKPLALVIDALDECDDRRSIAEFVEVIIAASQESPRLPLRIFITSRVEEHIRMKLEPSVARVYHLSLQYFNASLDIRKFFRSNFTAIYDAKRRVMRNVELPWPSESDIDALTTKSDGSFIFAVTLMDVIRNGSSHPQVELRNALITEGGLDNLYSQVLLNAPRDDNFDRVFGTVMLLTSPLAICVLADLLHLNAGEIVHTLNGVQSILMIPTDDDHAIRLFHTSLRDFLKTRGRSRDCFINLPFRHLCIAADCLLIICKPPEDSLFYEDESQKYACENWCYHVQQGLIDSGGDSLHELLSETSLMNCLQDFASNTFDFWVNTLLSGTLAKNVLTTLSLALESLEQLPDYSQNLLHTLQGIRDHLQV